MPARHVNPRNGFYRQAVGDLTVTAINDGTFRADFDLIAGIDHAECARLERAALRALPPLMTMNTFLVETGKTVALIDTGCGASMGPTLGMTTANLEAIGIAPDDVDIILMTHLHLDHMNGLIDEQGAAVFPNAELLVHEEELSFVDDPSAPARAPEPTHGFFAAAHAAIGPYRSRLRTVKEGPVLPGVAAISTPGHTPGHTAWLMESAGDRLLVWGDIVHMPSIQLAVPEAGTVLDIDRELAVQTRRRMLDMAATEGLKVAGIHHDFPAFGYIRRQGPAYSFVPQVWTAALSQAAS
jgi:glyoxylase-like metal-dependent hydrolase (beta-lactamase superfamily II)